MIDVLQRRGQHLAVEAQFLTGLVEHRDDLVDLHARTLERTGHQQARRGRAHRGGELALGELQPGAVGRGVEHQGPVDRDGVLVEHAARGAVADDATGQREQVADADVAVPVLGGEGAALGIRIEKRRRTQAFVERGAPARRDQQQRAHVEQQRPERPVGQRVPAAEAEQRPGTQPAQTQRPVHHPGRIEQARFGELGQQQRIAPDAEAEQQADFDAAAAGAAPVQPADQRRGELRDRDEGHQPERRQRGLVAAGAVVDVGQRRQADDRAAPHPQHRRCDVAAVTLRIAPAQQQRHHQVVADHRRERDRRHDDHAGRRREAADIGEQGEQVGVVGHRQGQHETVGRHRPLAAEQRHAGAGDRQHHQADHHQIAAEQPARAADVAHVAALHHRHVELARQADDRCEREQALHREARRRGVGDERMGGVGHRQRVAAEPRHREHAHRHQRDQLHQRLERDRQHHAGAVLGGVHGARAEQDREQRHQRRDVERGVTEGRDRIVRPAEHAETDRHRLVLQREVGHRGDQRDQRHHRRQPLRAAVAGGDEVGDRDRVLRLRDQRQALEDAPAEQQQQQGADVDRQIAHALAHRGADCAVERPRRAVDRQRQAVDGRAQPGPVGVERAPVAVPGHAEQQRGIAQRHQKQDPARQHAAPRSAIGQVYGRAAGRPRARGRPAPARVAISPARPCSGPCPRAWRRTSPSPRA